MKARHEFNSEQEYKRYLRVYISVLAMQGMCSSLTALIRTNGIDIAQQSTMIADELLKHFEYEKQNTKNATGVL